MTVTYTNFGGRVVAENRDGVKRGYVHDPQGNVIALVDEDGAITDTWEYWPYGEVKSHTGSSPTPFTYGGAHGYYTDPTGLTYVRARYYNAPNGQWQTMDPLWPEEPSYSYVWGNPITESDPSGMQGIPPRVHKEITIPIIVPGPGGPTIIGWVTAHIGYGNYCGGDRNPLKECPANKPPLPFPTPWDNIDDCCVDHDASYNKYGCDWWRNISQDCRDADKRLCDCLKKRKCGYKTKREQDLCNNFRNDAISWFCDVKPKL